MTSGLSDIIDRVSRRTVLKSTATTTGVLAGITGASSLASAQKTTFKFGGKVAGWMGRSPAAIKGKKNPTLSLQPGATYKVVWKNLDGLPHNFVIEDANGKDLVRSKIIRQQGATQTVTFTANKQMAEYYCEIHPQTMRGKVKIGGSSSQEGSSGGMSPSTSDRINTSGQMTVRDFTTHNYERLYTHRKTKSLEILLEDPAVNKVARQWVASFEAHEPLTNHIDMIGVQGPKDVKVKGGLGKGYTVTAVDRQTIYGLVDRYTNELIALQINKPTNATWKESYDKAIQKRTKAVLEQPEVKKYIGNADSYPSFKVSEQITSYGGLPKGVPTAVPIFVAKKGGVSVVSGWVNVSDPKNPTYIDSYVHEQFVEFPPHKIAEEITPKKKTVRGKVPKVPFEKRPWLIANNGYHRFNLPKGSFTQNGWHIEWEPPTTQGVTVQAAFNGKPVFEAMNNPVTYTGYLLPPKKDKSISEWYFPKDKPLFNGYLLFWDIHSQEFGGPGFLGKIDLPKRRGHPAGFRFKTHYHTGAEPSAVDFHSGLRFGPYNYIIAYEWFADGNFRTIWRRNGPGYVVEGRKHAFPIDYKSGNTGVIQHYTAATALDMTPGTTKGVNVQLFDGDSWKTPKKEFYEQGSPSTIVRFSNPSGPEQIDIPVARDQEIAVVRRHSNEIGPGNKTATRLQDQKADSAFYHPSQYADGEPIQGKRVIAWILMPAATDQMPHPAGITTFAVVGEMQLQGYGAKM